jgi:hypothetical protein
VTHADARELSIYRRTGATAKDFIGGAKQLRKGHPVEVGVVLVGLCEPVVCASRSALLCRPGLPDGRGMVDVVNDVVLRFQRLWCLIVAAAGCGEVLMRSCVELIEGSTDLL